MTTLSVPDMHCNMCVKNVTKALDRAGIAHSPVSLDTKSVDIEGDAETIKKACTVLDDAGFPASAK